MTSSYESVDGGAYTFFVASKERVPMKKSLISLAIFSMAATPVLAGNTMPRAEAALVPAAAEVQAKRMTDADMDKVTAGVSIDNPGKAMVFITHKSGKVTCINVAACLAPPPPPPPVP